MGVEATRNSFRAAVIHGEKKPLVVTDKNPRFEGEHDAVEIIAAATAIGWRVKPPARSTTRLRTTSKS